MALSGRRPEPQCCAAWRAARLPPSISSNFSPSIAPPSTRQPACRLARLAWLASRLAVSAYRDAAAAARPLCNSSSNPCSTRGRKTPSPLLRRVVKGQCVCSTQHSGCVGLHPFPIGVTCCLWHTHGDKGVPAPPPPCCTSSHSLMSDLLGINLLDVSESPCSR